MNKTTNQKAWIFLAPVLILVAFNAFIPLMTVINYSVQETFGNNLISKGKSLSLVMGDVDHGSVQ